MASDESADDAVFTDCAASGSESRPPTPASRRRQISVPEMVRLAESRKAKRPAPDRSSRSPRDPAPPAAKRLPAGSAGPAEGAPRGAQPAGVELSVGALAEIRCLLDASVSSVIKAFEIKFEQMEKRLNYLESELTDKDTKIQHLGELLSQQIQINTDLQAQVESIDLNRRLASLIFTCDDFGARSVDDRIEEKVVRLLNSRIPDLRLTTADIHAAHRLQRDDKVIVRFVKRAVRDAIYDARFNMTSSAAGERASRSPLYISESLTAYNQNLFNQLLQARKTSNGARVASVFTRRGLVFCRTVKGGRNIRVPDEDTLRKIIGASDPATSWAASRSPSRGRGDRPPGAPVPTRGGDGGRGSRPVPSAESRPAAVGAVPLVGAPVPSAVTELAARQSAMTTCPGISAPSIGAASVAGAAPAQAAAAAERTAPRDSSASRPRTDDTATQDAGAASERIVPDAPQAPTTVATAQPSAARETTSAAVAAGP